MQNIFDVAPRAEHSQIGFESETCEHFKETVSQLFSQRLSHPKMGLKTRRPVTEVKLHNNNACVHSHHPDAVGFWAKCRGRQLRQLCEVCFRLHIYFLRSVFHPLSRQDRRARPQSLVLFHISVAGQPPTLAHHRGSRCYRYQSSCCCCCYPDRAIDYSPFVQEQETPQRGESGMDEQAPSGTFAVHSPGHQPPPLSYEADMDEQTSPQHRMVSEHLSWSCW